MEALIKSFVDIAQSDLSSGLTNKPHYEVFWVKLAENMQARCANNSQCDLFSGSLIIITHTAKI